MQLKNQNTENHSEILFYFFVIPVAISMGALVVLWQFIFK